MKTVIKKNALIHSNKRAVQKFSEKLGYVVSKDNVHNYKREVKKHLIEGKDIDSFAIPTRKRGRPHLPENSMLNKLKKNLMIVRVWRA